MSVEKIGAYASDIFSYSANSAKKSSAAKKSDEKIVNADTLTLTENSDDLAQKENSREKQDSSLSYIDLEAFRRSVENSNENSQSSIVESVKCIKIARRIMNGDKVTVRDMKFLAEKQPELYKNAILFMKNNPEPKKYKSETNDEDKSDPAEKFFGKDESDDSKQWTVNSKQRCQ